MNLVLIVYIIISVCILGFGMFCFLWQIKDETDELIKTIMAMMKGGKNGKENRDS